MFLLEEGDDDDDDDDGMIDSPAGEEEGMVADCNAALTHWTVCPNNSRSDRLFMLLLGGTV